LDVILRNEKYLIFLIFSSLLKQGKNRVIEMEATISEEKLFNLVKRLLPDKNW
jgi:hypothetical protein